MRSGPYDALVPGASTLAVFTLAALALIVVPGPAVVYVLTQSVAHGRRAGLTSVAGIATGALVHVLAAAIGLSSLLVSSAIAFNVVKYLGAVYLVYLGIRRILGRDGSIALVDAPPKPLRRLFRDGFVVEVLNPKVALFFLAFLPQFVDPELGRVWLQIVVLGAIFVVVGILSDGMYAVVGGTFGGVLKRSRAYLRIERYVSGLVFVGLGVVAAVTGHRRAALG
jgi:threonine/homoserine/homoserine lactone efflux protein